MAEYIEREAFREVLKKSHKAHASNSREESLLDRDIRLLNEQPSVDVAKVRHGRWLYEPKFGSTRPYYCSLPDCGASYPGKFSYCPNCGAKMDL